MKRKLLLFSIIPFLFIMVLSCKKRSVTEEGKISMKAINRTEEHQLKGKGQNPILKISINLLFPDTLSNNSILKKTRQIILNDFFPDIDKKITDPNLAMKAYIKDYIKFFDESEIGALEVGKLDDETQQKNEWWDNEKMIIRHNSENILSYSIESERYTGGAHGGRSYLNTVINLKTGERITEDDLFTEESRPLIATIILKNLMAKNKVETAQDLELIGFFDVMEIGMNKNFYLTNEGLVYTYNEYEIAAYALGTIEVLLSYKDISGLMIPGNPIEELIP